MSKGKNRRQRQGNEDQSRSASEKVQEARNSSMERSRAQGSPADVARKHQRRFGHN